MGSAERLAGEYAGYLAAKNYKPRGIEEKLRAVRQFLRYAEQQGLDPCRLRGTEAESYREHLSLSVGKDGRPRYQPATINVGLSHLKSFYSFLVARGLAFTNPFFDAERLKEAYRIPKNILSIQEMGRLLQSLAVDSPDAFRFKLLLELLYATGARICEIENLALRDVELDSGYLLIRDDKERQERKAPLTEYACRLLALYLKVLHPKGSERLFPHGCKRSLNRWLNERLKRLTASLGLPRLTCHGIRHSVATHLFQSGAGIREVQEFLGHRRIKSTEVYTRVLEEDMKKALLRSHPREIRRSGGSDEAGS
jgi:site-specific recombinase XerD